ncbi:MAG: trigger factor, partial [Oscillospiraceae bacterium]|nr:trigger factor [Oscillospiraceae bacterium]
MGLKTAEKTGANTYTLNFEISGEDFEAAVQKVFGKQKSKINIPGFRKGKATRAFVERYYGADVFYNDAVELIFPDMYKEAVESEKIDTVGNPYDLDIQNIGREGVDMSCKTDVKPVIETPVYKGLSAVKREAAVTDEEVDAELARLQKQNARVINVDDRAVLEGDTVLIDFKGFSDGVPFDGGQAEGQKLKIGAGQFIPGFEEQIIGHNVGEEFDINVKFPENYTEELAGRDAVFTVNLHEISFEELPALDDDFAMDLSEFDTFAEFKEDVRKTILSEKEEYYRQEFEAAVREKLAENVGCEEIPDVMINDELQHIANEADYRFRTQQGFGLKDYMKYTGSDIDSFADSYRPNAERNIKLSLAVDKIIETEGIEAPDDEIEAEYARLADEYRMETEELKKAVNAETVKKDISVKKAYNIIYENAVKLPPEEEEAKNEAAGDESPKKTAPKKAKAKTAKKADNAEEPAAEPDAAAAEPPVKKTVKKTTKKAEK